MDLAMIKAELERVVEYQNDKMEDWEKGEAKTAADPNSVTLLPRRAMDKIDISTRVIALAVLGLMKTVEEDS